MTGGSFKYLKPIAAAFNQRLKDFGISPRAVFWNDAEGQNLRFELLLQVMGDDIHKKSLSFNDFGCGYGAFFDVIKDLPPMIGGSYVGYDLCESMITAAKRRIKDDRATFVEGPLATQRADYTFVSGTYNMKRKAPEKEWEAYIKGNLIHLWSQSAKGLAFNMLDTDKRKKREDWLYYPDAQDYLDFCRENLSPDSKLIDSAPLAEWTMLVRR